MYTTLAFVNSPVAFMVTRSRPVLRATFSTRHLAFFLIIGDLHRLFPRAKFVFLLRNPMAVLYSELQTYVKGDWPVLGLFAPDLLLAPHRIIEGIELLGEDAIVVRYEELVREPTSQLRSLCNRIGICYSQEMIDYSKTPAPKGSMNDPVGIHKHTRPSTDSVDRWRGLADTGQTRHFGQCYLRALGAELLDKLGYPYEPIATALGNRASARDIGLPLFPWEIAIRPKSQWSLRERFIAERYFAMRNKGRTRGTLVTFRNMARRLLSTALGQLRF